MKANIKKKIKKSANIPTKKGGVGLSVSPSKKKRSKARLDSRQSRQTKPKKQTKVVRRSSLKKQASSKRPVKKKSLSIPSTKKAPGAYS